MKRYGFEACCMGCNDMVQQGCELVGQCDIMDPCDIRESVERLGEDPGEPKGNPFDFFGNE